MAALLTSAPSVVIVDDHAVFAEALSSVLTARGGVGAVRVAGTVADGLAAIEELRPGLVVLDVRLGSEDGLAVLEAVAATSPDTRTVVLTGHPRPDVIRRASERGAVVLPKGIGLDELLDRLAAVLAGDLAPDRVLIPGLPDLSGLSTREAQVLGLLAEVADVTQVARRLGLSPHTVRDHIKSARAKLGAQSQLAAVLEALRRGEIEFPAR